MEAPFKLPSGHAYEEIVRFLGESETDLLLIGASATAGLSRWCWARPSSTVLRNAPCPVFLSR